MLRPLLIVGMLVLAVVWAAVAGTNSYRSWPRTDAQLVRERDIEHRRCAARYIEQAAVERCEVLIETTYVMERNIAVFTRALLALGPLLAVGGWAMFTRPQNRRSTDHRHGHQ